MATFPGNLVSLTNPSSGAGDTLASVPHDTQHANANDEIEAIEAKVGKDGSAVVTSHDYLLNHLAPGATVALPSDITPAQITADQDNYNPTGLQTSTVLRLNTNASRNITGLTAPTTAPDGNVKAIVNVGANPIVLKHASTNSSAANRFDIGADITLGASQGIVLWYDTTSSRWRPLASVSAAGGGGGGSVATDVIWNAKGDLAGGTGADAAAVLSVGANNRILVADSTSATGFSWKVMDDLSHPAGLGEDSHHPKLHGPDTHINQLRSRFIPAQEFNVAGGAGGAIGALPYEVRTQDLDPTTDERVRTSFLIPIDWISGMAATIWYAPNGTPGAAGQAVRWDIGYKVIADGGDAAATGTTVSFTGSTGTGAANEVIVEAPQSITTGLVAGGILVLTVNRDANHAGDTLSIDAGFIGLYLEWTADQ